MKDVQTEKPKNQVSIEQVGIKNFHYPIRVLRKNNDYQHSIANIELSVQLPSDSRGTHMSRFVELIEKHKSDINNDTIETMLENIKTTFNSGYAYAKVIFPYFVEKRAPVSRISSILETSCGFICKLENGKITKTLTVKVPVTTLCPCSKEISEYGAHNQRAYVLLDVDTLEMIWFEDLIDIIEQSASAPIYPLLKRPDEKYVTEQAYNNPRFVEDLAREVYEKTTGKYKMDRIKIVVESDESIHTHMAFAKIEKELLVT